MATVYTYMPMDQRIVTYGKHRVVELEKQITADRNEIEMWNRIIEQQGLCDYCNGEKTMRVQDCQAESHTEPCGMCNGTGKAKGL